MKANSKLPPLNEMIDEICDWFSSDLGEQLLAAEQLALDRVMDSVFGYHLLQISLLGDHPLHQRSSASHKFTMLPAIRLGMPEEGVVGNAGDLPFASECIDAVILHHALDFAQSPHQVLREASRVLRPGGKLIVVGFNPTSFWGLYRTVAANKSRVPWCGCFIRQRRLYDWLTLLELKQERLQSGFYRPPLHSPRWMQKLNFLERWGQRYLAGNGGFYLSLASKETLAMTALGSNWRRRLVFPLVSKPIQQAGRDAAARTSAAVDDSDKLAEV